MKGEGTIFPKAGKSFDPILIPKAVHDAGFTATEVKIVVDGTLATRSGASELDVPGLKHPFMLAGASQEDTLKKQRDLVGRKIRLTGKVQIGQADHPPTLSIESFRLSP